MLYNSYWFCFQLYSTPALACVACSIYATNFAFKTPKLITKELRKFSSEDSFAKKKLQSGRFSSDNWIFLVILRSHLELFSS